MAPARVVNRVIAAYIHDRVMLTRVMPLSAKPKRRPVRGLSPAPKSYHHGDLRRVLIDAALTLVEEGGTEALSVREAARRAISRAARP